MHCTYMTCKLLLHNYIVAERYFQQLEVNSVGLLTALTRSGANDERGAFPVGLHGHVICMSAEYCDETVCLSVCDVGGS